MLNLYKVCFLLKSFVFFFFYSALLHKQKKSHRRLLIPGFLLVRKAGTHICTLFCFPVVELTFHHQILQMWKMVIIQVKCFISEQQGYSMSMI